MKRIIMLVFVMLLAASVSRAGEKREAPAKIATRAVEKSAEAPVTRERIDINAATEAELKSLTGITEVYAQKIIVGRPYTLEDQLKTKKIIPASTYENIRGKIIAKKPKTRIWY